MVLDAHVQPVVQRSDGGVRMSGSYEPTVCTFLGLENPVMIKIRLHGGPWDGASFDTWVEYAPGKRQFHHRECTQELKYDYIANQAQPLEYSMVVDMFLSSVTPNK